MRVLFALIGIWGLCAFAPQDIEWFSLLGQTFEDTDVNAKFGKYGEFDWHSFRNDDETQVNWSKHGIAVTMNDLGEIQKIYFFNDQYTTEDHTFQRFSGALPYGITLDMNPKKVKELIGKPSLEEGSAYKIILYKTTFEYEFLFRDDVMMYMRIGLLPQAKD